MKRIYEIYLTKPFVSKEEWQEFINIISSYNGLWKSWKIIIINHKNTIRFLIQTNISLPATINHLNSFVLKKQKLTFRPKYHYRSLTLFKTNKNIIDLINEAEIKKQSTLKCIEIKIMKQYENKIRTKTNIYIEKKGTIKKKHILGAIPTDILSIDFKENKRYLYKKVPKYLDITKAIHLLNTEPINAMLSVDTFPYLQGKFYLNQNNFSFDKHSIIMGSSGSGKSKLISLIINNIYKCNNLKQKYKVVVIDPHASMENDIGGIGRVIDFKDQLDSIDLFINDKENIVSTTELLLELLKSLLISQYNSKLERVLRHSIYLLVTDECFNFKTLRKLLLDLEYRNSMLHRLKNELPNSVVDFFQSDFNDLKTTSYTEAISPIIGFIDEMEMLPVFNRESSQDNLKSTINENFLTLFSLDRTKLGDKVTKTIAGLIMQQLLTIVQKQEIKQHIILIIDEVAVIEHPILVRLLSEARKYHLSLILAGQYFNQISEELKNSIYANVINYFIFRVSQLDANTLVDNFNMKIPVEDTKENKVKLLTELQARECIVRIDSNDILLPAFKGRTIDFKSIPRKKRIMKENNHQENKPNQSSINFNINSKVSLKEILKLNSSSRKVVKE